MPDGDLYDRNGEKWWRTAAQRVYELDDDPRALQALLWSLQKTSNNLGGWPGIDLITETLGDLVHPISASTRFQAIDQLERIRRTHLNDRTDRAVDIACHVLAELEQRIPRGIQTDRVAVRTLIAKHILVDIAMATISPVGFLTELQERKGVPRRAVKSRRERAREQLFASAELAPIVQRVLNHPLGWEVQLPRIKVQRESQAQILTSPAA